MTKFTVSIRIADFSYNEGGVWFGVGRLSHIEDASQLSRNKKKSLTFKGKWLVEAKSGKLMNPNGSGGAALAAVASCHCGDIIKTDRGFGIVSRLIELELTIARECHTNVSQAGYAAGRG